MTVPIENMNLDSCRCAFEKWFFEYRAQLRMHNIVLEDNDANSAYAGFEAAWNTRTNVPQIEIEELREACEVLATEEIPLTKRQQEAVDTVLKHIGIQQKLQPDHPDDVAVDAFATKMKEKLAKKRAEGRGGWEVKTQCNAEFLSQLLREHVDKGDPVDVANLSMMLSMRGEGIAKPQPTPSRKKTLEELFGYLEPFNHPDFSRWKKELSKPHASAIHKLNMHIVLDALATAAHGEPLDPEISQAIESIVKEYDHKDFTDEDIQALYDCGSCKCQSPDKAEAV